MWHSHLHKINFEFANCEEMCAIFEVQSRKRKRGEWGILAWWAKSGVGASEGCNLFLLQAGSLPWYIRGDDDGRRPLEQEIHVTPAKELSPNLINKLGTQ